MGIKIYLARHGETEENKLRILQGHMPGTLTEEGKRQAQELGDTLKADCDAEMIFCSDLQRCRDTVEIINRELNLPIVYSSQIRERDWGNLTGISLLKQRIRIDDSAESIAAMYQRGCDFLKMLLEEYEGKCLLIVSHGLFIRILISLIEDRYFKEIKPMTNAEVRVFDVERIEPHFELKEKEDRPMDK